jgi:hypothetical protein
VLLTIDATPEVVAEAVRVRTDCLVSYHPPLFEPKRRYSRQSEPLLFAAASAPFAVYSPHTALDAARNGLNDWLARCLGAGEIEPLVTARQRDSELKLVVFVPEENADRLRSALAAAGAGVIGAYTSCSFNLKGEGTFFGDDGSNPSVGERGRLERVPELRLEMVCPGGAVPRVTRALLENHPYEEPAWELYALAGKPSVGAGRARRITFPQPRPLLDVLAELKANLGLSHVRLAASALHRAGAPVLSATVAAGAGSASFAEGPPSDLYVTGEMRHHDVLAWLARGKSVILCEHSSSERGYLPDLRERLLGETRGEVSVAIAEQDTEPLVLA